MRAPGQPALLVTRRIRTPLGPMVAIANDAGILLLEFADGPRLAGEVRRLRSRLGATIERRGHPHLTRLDRELRTYFAGRLRAFTVPLAPVGTGFQLAVWRRLQRIPYGGTLSYERLARALGRPGAQRAVGHANGANPLAIVVPCHRLVGADGSLRGYGGGLWRKRRLLELEGTLPREGPGVAGRPARWRWRKRR